MAAEPIHLWSARGPAELYAVGEIRQFEIVQAGQTIGRSWGRYGGTDEAGHHVFETRIELLPPGGAPLRSEGRLIVDDEGALVSGFERSDAAELSYVREGDAVVTVGEGRRDEIAYREGDAFVAHGAVLHSELMFALRTLREDRLDWRIVSLSGGPPVAWNAEIVDAPARDGDRFSLQTSLGERVVLRDGRIVEVVAAEADHRVVVVGTPAWPQWEIEGPRALTWTKPPDATWSVREVELPGRAGEPSLMGEVLVPAGKGPHPAAVFLSRMAGEDRYGFVRPPPVDIGSHAIHDALVEAGFVVLRFDERGVGDSEPGTASYDAQVEDARRAWRTVLVQPEVDPDRVVVIGHGEGGLRALALGAAYGKDVAGVALLGAPGRPYLDVLRYQGRVRLAAAPPEVRQETAKEQERLLEALAKGESPPELGDGAQWLREIMLAQPAKLMARVEAPLWLAQPGNDFEVDPQADLDALVAAAKRGRKKHRVSRYPKLDHRFMVEPGLSTPAQYLEARPVDESFLADLVTWARRVTR